MLDTIVAFYVREADDVLEMIQVQYSPAGGAWESMNEAVASGSGVMAGRSPVTSAGTLRSPRPTRTNRSSIAKPR